MRTTSLFSGALVITSVAAMVGCGAPAEPESEELVDQATEGVAAVPFCWHGMTTSVRKIDPFQTFSKMCTIGELKDMVEYVCKTDPVVCDFLNNTLKGHGGIQCEVYTDASGTANHCASVIDRNPDGSSLEDPKSQIPPYARNFFVAYTNDVHYPMSPEVGYWNSQLTTPALTAPPVSLSFAGRISQKPALFYKAFGPQPYPDNRVKRLVKFDPRECGSCGFMYDGPNSAYANPADVSLGWWPGYDNSTCMFEEFNGQPFAGWHPLTIEECIGEQVYRDTGRR